MQIFRAHQTTLTFMGQIYDTYKIYSLIKIAFKYLSECKFICRVDLFEPEHGHVDPMCKPNFTQLKTVGIRYAGTEQGSIMGARWNFE